MRWWIQNDVAKFEWESNRRILKIAQRIEIRKYKKDFLEIILRNKSSKMTKELVCDSISIALREHHDSISDLVKDL